MTIPISVQKEVIQKSENLLRLETKNICIAFSDLIALKEELLNE